MRKRMKGKKRFGFWIVFFFSIIKTIQIKTIEVSRVWAMVSLIIKGSFVFVQNNRGVRIKKTEMIFETREKLKEIEEVLEGFIITKHYCCPN